jgi:succinyl-CoA synthetase beta subunit
MVKAQVLAGGRGKAGGVRPADTPEEAYRAAATLLGTSVRGLPCEAVLVEERLQVVREYYLGLVVNSATGSPTLLVGAAGGVDIEAHASHAPGGVRACPLDPLTGLTPATAAAATADLGAAAAAGAAVAMRLYEVFADQEAMIAEINPLVLTPEGRLVAADAVCETDEAARFRHPDWRPRDPECDPRAEQARQLGMTFVPLAGGEIGLICSGAGLAMATMDLIAAAGGPRPANFLETGGGITRELMAAALRLVLDQPGLRAVLVNVYGGINPIHEGALGLAEVLGEGPTVPIVAKALGNRQEETWQILRRAGVDVVTELTTEKAVAAVLRQAQTGQEA